MSVSSSACVATVARVVTRSYKGTHIPSSSASRFFTLNARNSAGFCLCALPSALLSSRFSALHLISAMLLVSALLRASLLRASLRLVSLLLVSLLCSPVSLSLTRRARLQHSYYYYTTDTRTKMKINE